MHSVFSVSSSLVTATESMFFLTVKTHHQHRPEGDVSHFISLQSLLAYLDFPNGTFYAKYNGECSS